MGVRGALQGYLAHKTQHPPWDHHRALGIVLLKGPRERLFLVSEVPLSGSPVPVEGGRCVLSS